MVDSIAKNPEQVQLAINDELLESLDGSSYSVDEVDPGSGDGFSRLTMLQALSPQLKKGDNHYLHEAAVGNFCIVSSDVADVCKQGVAFIPCYHRTEHVHWGPRGSGIVKNYYEDKSILSKCRREGYKYLLPNGDEIVETSTWYGFATELDDQRPLSELANAAWLQVMFPLKHSGWTEHKAFRKQIDSEKLVTLASGRRWKPPLFWRVWLLTQAGRHNRRNQDWEGWTAAPGPTLHELDPTDGMLQMAKLFADERIAEARRYKLDPQDKRPLIDVVVAEPRG